MKLLTYTLATIIGISNLFIVSTYYPLVVIAMYWKMVNGEATSKIFPKWKLAIHFPF